MTNSNAENIKIKIRKHNNFYGFRLIFVGAVSLTMLLASIFVYTSFVEFTGLSSSILAVFMLVSGLSFIISNSLINDMPGKISDNIYHISCILNGIVFWFFLVSIPLWVLYAINSDFNFNLLNLNINMRVVALITYVASILLNIYGLFVARNIKIIQVKMPIKNLPATWQDKKAVFISDTHYGPIYQERAAKKLVNIINSINPSYLFHTGDFFDGPKMDWAKVASEYKNINQSIKKYFVSGNHDEYAEKGVDDPQEILSAISDAGFIIMDGKMIDENGLQIVGIEYDRKEDKNKILDNFTSNNFDKNKPSIILKHVPRSTQIISELGASLMLCGHTHNGQMFPFNILTKLVYKGFNFGLKYQGELAVYTTSGVGSWGSPQRIGTRSEVIVFEFTRAGLNLQKD